MSLTDGMDLFAAGTMEETLDIVIHAWRDAFSADAYPWVPALDEDTAADMARLTRIVVEFVDFYTGLRLQHFREALDPPRGEWPVSPTERRRIAQALMRSQIFVSIHHPSFTTGGFDDEFFVTAIGLFESWELEQISAMANFVLNVIWAVHRHGKHGLPPPIYQYGEPWWCGLPVVYAQVVKAGLTDDTFLPGLWRDPTICDSKVRIGSTLNKWLSGSHRCLWWDNYRPSAAMLAMVEPSAEEAAAPPLAFDGDSILNVPWAWIHAWNGQRVRRWGSDLVPVRPPGPNADWNEHGRVTDLMWHWRWFGCVFWDKDRAEALMESEAFEGCGRGWFASYLASGDASGSAV
ncbi:uncharacterized protein C8A04DRAFT_24915 [Dichotomopilus funicola]|uniref:Uncharacterized protein n=1 Tax=Dichotomopilus funicola TaxID=1934379 RepID=A0AAN6V966_9PEZI|nr:hypothetical protein C8A04DRAFT_24915 [Dichotomopilus funicola]